jgi:histone H3/H4
MADPALVDVTPAKKPSGRGKSNSYVKRVLPPDAIIEEKDAVTGIVTLSLKQDDTDMLVPGFVDPSGAEYAVNPVVEGSSRGPMQGPGSKSGVKRKHRYRPGTVALREIRKEQSRGDMMIRGAPFRRLVREISSEFIADMRFQADAFLAIQEAVEQYAVDLFQVSNLIAIHGGRPTILGKDLKLAAEIRRSGRGE